MNPFTTVPRFIRGYKAAKEYTKKKDDFEKLRAAGDVDGEKEAIRIGQKKFADSIVDIMDMHVEVVGEENIPDVPFMLYSNHQSFADIPAICYAVGSHCMMGFVSKAEWKKYKILRDAIEYTRSIFLNRGNPREAVKAVSEVKKLLDMGFNMAIFPEGTRSKCHEMGEFKAGAFKFAEKANVPVLPVTLDGGYKLFEEKGTYQPCSIKVTIHPPVHLEKMDKHQQKEAAAEIENIIRSALD